MRSEGSSSEVRLDYNWEGKSLDGRYSRKWKITVNKANSLGFDFQCTSGRGMRLDSRPCTHKP